MPAPWLDVREAPRPQNAIDRPHLREYIDRQLNTRLLWIAGPDGIGKSTLAATYVARHRFHCLWLDLSEEDADPGHFFAHVRGLLRSPHFALPYYVPELAGDVLGFAARFFVQLAKILPSGTRIVLDNLDLIPGDSALPMILREAVDVSQPAFQWLMLSRDDVFPDLEYLVALYQGAKIDQQAQRLTAQDLAELWPEVAHWSEPQRASLLDRCEGLIGILKPLRGLSDDRAVPDELFASHRGKEFYLACAHAYLSRQSETVRQAINALALLQARPLVAIEMLAPDAGLAAALRPWVRMDAFVQQCGDGVRLHGLFRDSLLDAINTQMDPRQRYEMQRYVARYCERSGQCAQAISLYRDAGDWADMGGLLRREAEIEIGQGRWLRVRQWLESIPDPVLEASPMLRYWLARALLPEDPELARLCFRRVRSQFERIAQPEGQAMAIAGMIWASIQNESSSADLAVLVSDLDSLLDGSERFSTRAIELSVLCAYVIAAVWSATAPGGLARRASRAHALLDAFDIRANDKQLAASHLMTYYDVIGRTDLGDRLLELVPGLVGKERIAHHARCLWRLSEGRHLALTGRRGAAMMALSDAVALGQFDGLRTLELAARHARLPLLIEEGRLPEAQDDLQCILGLTRPRESLGLAYQAICASLLARAHGNTAEATHQWTVFVEAAVVAVPRFTLLEWGIHIVWQQATQGDLSGAHYLLVQLEKRTQHYCYAPWRVGVLLLHAHIARLTGDVLSHEERLRQALMLMRDNLSWGHALRPIAALVAEQMAYALEHAVLPDAAVKLVNLLNLRAPSAQTLNWPWAARICAFGGLRAATSERAYEKVSGMAGTLLAQLIVAGDEGVSIRHMAESLCPAAPGMKARRALKRAVNALRNRLGSEASVLQSQQRLHLNPGSCWVDAWAFTRLAQRDAPRALALYQGMLLPRERGGNVSVHRTGLHERYIELVTSYGKSCEDDTRHEAALALYRAGLEIDANCEMFYQGVMRCELRLGRVTEARRAYDLLTQALAAQPGLQPSTVSQNLLAMITPQASPQSEAGDEGTPGALS